MKKSILFMVAVLGLLTACDPSKDDLSMPTSSLTADQLSGGFATTQYSDEECTTQAADGNYFTFTTSPPVSSLSISSMMKAARMCWYRA
jgi:hypothetical protein